MSKLSKPILGIISCRKYFENAYTQSVIERYIAVAAKYMDVCPVLIPSLPELLDFEALTKTIDGVLLTGSASNVYPTHYGDKEEDAKGPFDHNRDQTSMALCDAFINASKPVFGICRGFQELNVHFGGTLARDMSEDDRPLKHHAPKDVSYDEMFAYGHDVEILENTPLSEIYGKNEMWVNSVHYQGIKELGAKLSPYAKAPDGVIESFGAKINDTQVFAVQWHPEWETDKNPEYQKLFEYWGKIIRKEA